MTDPSEFRRKSYESMRIMNKSVIVDVRAKGEYVDRHASGTINMPVDKLKGQIRALRRRNLPVILCGGGDKDIGQAEEILRRHHIECLNAGSWEDVDLFRKMSR